MEYLEVLKLKHVRDKTQPSGILVLLHLSLECAVVLSGCLHLF